MILVYGTGKSGTRLERNMDAKTDESAGKCPVMHKTNRDWWPNQLDLQGLHRTYTLSDPMGEAFDYAKEFKSLDLKAVMAGRLRPLRRTDDPHGVAQRGHLPHRRRPRRRRRRPAAFRTTQLVAGQREPRQGAPAAVADQAEVRPETLLRRAYDSPRQRRPRLHRLQE